ncbi:GNAT family N-acetyltransferase [Streptomyces sp. 900116325]|uniref:GNAT family N-acetyltransferase n=1 Tax=Streptomyces sp. NPDC000133 TaxID=3364535 RepID=UPI0036A160FD
MQPALIKRVSNIGTLAVHPAYRGRGIARSILSRVEEDFRRTGFVALTLRHEHDRKYFLGRHGYTSTSRLGMVLPPVGLVNRGWRHAAPSSP